jgi:hypothetical protein
VYCGQCGTPNNEEAGHCETCGAPLLISAGARTCGQCGSSLGDHDRFCVSCGASASNGGAADVYDAADDFGELDIDEIQMDELPDWLQGMAPSTPEPSPRAPVPDQPSPDDLPDWLRDDSPATPTSRPASSGPRPASPVDTSQASTEHQPADQFSLVSDDDLPDWLKALSDDDGDTEFATSTSSSPAPAASSSSSYSSSRPVSQPDRSRALANLHDVPVVSRAWQRQGRQVDQSQVTAARQEFLPLDMVAGVSPGEARSRSIWDAEPMHSAEDAETQPFALSSDENEPEEISGAESGRGKLIARIAILILLVMIALLLAYVFIQGV